MNNNPCMAIETTRELFYKLLEHGIDKSFLSKKTGIDLELLQHAEGRFPVRQHLRLWRAAEELLTHAAVGLRMGSLSDPYNRGIVGLIFLASQDLEAAIANKIRYTKILADHISLEIRKTADQFSVTYSILEGFFHRYEIERVFAGFLNWIRIFVDRRINPIQLSFQYTKPQCIQIYEQYFQCPIFFDQPKNEIRLPADLLKTKNAKHNDYLYSILQTRAESVLSQLDRQIDFVASIRSTIAGRLCNGNFSAQEIAAAHHISLRTLHRKLNEQDTTYQNILDNVRQQMALSYCRPLPVAKRRFIR